MNRRRAEARWRRWLRRETGRRVPARHAVKTLQRALVAE